MQKKDMSEIVEILRTNGVGFLICFFRSGLHLDDEKWNTQGEEKPWRIDFSDGKKYLGSLDTNTDNIDCVESEPSEISVEGETIKKFTLYLGKNLGTENEVTIHFTFLDIPGGLYGNCLISCESTELE